MRKPTIFLLACLTIVALALPALAQKKRGPGKPTPPRAAEQCKELQGDEAEACKAIGRYLDSWKEQKWAEVKKLVHPMTLDKIATVKKNLGEERHTMAPWYWAKETFLLNDWKIESIEPGAQGTIVINTIERSYRVEEDGFSEDDKSSYLAGRKNGTWYVTDRRSGGGGFTEDSIRLGLKGFFDEAKKPATADSNP